MSAAWRDAPVLARRAALVGVAALALCALGAWRDAGAFYSAWLVSWLFLLGIALGSMAFLMIHVLTGGAWGRLVAAPLVAAMLSLPLLALLALPLAFGLPALFAWARPDVVAHSDLLLAKAWFLNAPAFLARNGAWLMAWSAFALALAQAMKARDARAPARRRRIAVAGLPVYLLTVTVTAYDWVASLVPAWHSTAIGVRVGSGQFVAAWAFAVAFTLRRARHRGTASPPQRSDCQDFGNLLLTVTMMWAYIAFTQYLIVWGEDLPSEIAWYLPRLDTSWRSLGLAVALADFVLPFIAMLSRDIKRNPRALCSLCLLSLAGQWLDSVWLVAPSLRPAGLAFGWQDAAALLAQGGLWLAWVAALAARDDAAAFDARREEVAVHG